MRGRQSFGCRLCVRVMLMVALGVHQSAVVRAQEMEDRSFIQVLDAAGSAVTDLTAEDFVIQQGGVDCKVIRVELINDPLRLAMIVDDAEGAEPYFRDLRDGLPLFVDALPEDSQVALILLSGRPRVVVDFEDGLAKVKERLEGFFVDAATAAGFFNGVRETVARFEDVRWPVMALVTTDGPSMAATSFTPGKFEALVEQIVELGVTAHALGLNTRDGDGYQTGLSRQLAQITGGWYDSLNGPSRALGEKLTAMAEEISQRHAAAANQYLIVFEPAPGATPNTLISAGVRRPQVTLGISSDGRPISLGASPASLLADAADGDAGRGAEGASREEFWNAAENAFASGDVDVAAGLYEKAHEADPTWGKPLFKLALVALNKGDTETAVKYFEQVLEVDPDSDEGAQAKTLIPQLKK